MAWIQQPLEQAVRPSEAFSSAVQLSFLPALCTSIECLFPLHLDHEWHHPQNVSSAASLHSDNDNTNTKMIYIHEPGTYVH